MYVYQDMRDIEKLSNYFRLRYTDEHNVIQHLILDRILDEIGKICCWDNKFEWGVRIILSISDFNDNIMVR